MLFMIFFWLGMLLRFVGGFALVGIFVYGVYALFAETIGLGLLLIGASVVGSWVIHLVTGLLMVTGVGLTKLTTNNEQIDDL